MTILTSWWYSRKIEVPSAAISFSDVPKEASALLKLGSAFMASSLMTMGVAYVVRIIILRRIGIEAIGFYQSAWTLGGLYVGFVLQAMGADFYPRLTASIHNHKECNRLVNEQTLVGLLLAGPGVLATLTFAPLVITLFYSVKFAAAVAVLRWICLGVTLQVITWPMGFIIVAKGRPAVFVAAELGWTVVAVVFAWLGVRAYGLNGAGIAFFGSYVFHIFLTYPLASWLTGFRWSTESQEKGLAFLSLIGLVFGSFYVMPFVWAASIGTVAAAASGVYSARFLATLVPLEDIPRPVRKLLVGMRLVGGARVITPEIDN
jgi:PST family polysaccharide transporter